MRKIVACFISLFMITICYSQSPANFNPPYPRVAMDNFDPPNHSYSNGTKIKQLKDFDMVILYGPFQYKGHILGPILRSQKSDQILLAMSVNGINITDPPPFFLSSSYRAVLLAPLVPNQTTILVNTVADLLTSNKYVRINNDIVQITSVPNETTLVAIGSGNGAVNVAHAAGDTVMGVYRVLGQGFRPFFSESCPELGGQKVWDYIAEENFVDEMDWTMNLFDGIFHDYFNVELYVAGSNYDFDFNGIDDRTEHSEDWMLGQWQYGIENMIDAEDSVMNALSPTMPNILSVNTGGSLHHYYDKLHGHMFEGYQRFTTWHYIHIDAVNWMALGRKPSVVYFMDYFPEKHFHDGKNRFSQVRFGLTHSMITEAYYGYTGGDVYSYWYWYDEFETDMGYPVGNIFTLNGQTYLLGRYFDNGVVLCNGTGANQVISAGQLSGGPYYFLKGGQDPVRNTGQQFTGTLTLVGINYGNHNLRGDGVLLFKNPTTVVADIIIDNFFMNATSPGNDAVRLVGTWRKKSAAGYADFTQDNPYWALSGSKQKISIPEYDIDGANGIFDENYGYHASSSGSGENTATYIPTIGVPGWYEVSEWHGWDGDTPGAVVEATNVPFEINVSGQAKIRGIINQSIDAGQWNRLGYVNLPAGTQGYVRITNKANGVVIADAMRFRYMGDNYVPDSTPPERPKNVQVF